MQKFIGCILIVLAGSGMGYFKGVALQQHISEMEEIRQLFLMLRSEIKYTKTPLGEAFYHIGRRMDGVYGTWLKELSGKLEEKSGAVFREVWSGTIEECLKNTALWPKDLRALKAIGVHMGYMDEEMQIGTIDLFVEQLNVEIQNMRQNIAIQRRLCNCLGVLGGVFLAVVLI